MVTLSKIISNGKIDGKNSEGEYKSGTQVEARNIALARVAPVVAPKGKDLFDQWTEDDWQNVDKQKDEVFSKFTETLEQTSKMLAQNTAVISSIESKNEKLFQERKKAQEEADSFLKDMVLAYVTGGMAGIKSAIRGKIEDKINMELAKAFIQATGGSPDQVQLFSDAMGFMRGKVQERNIKKRANTFSINNPIRSLENFYSKQFSAMSTFYSSIPIVGPLVAGLNQIGTAIALSATRAVMGPKAYDAKMDQITGPKNKIAEIKANEKALTKSYATRAVAHATGLPAEVVGNIITDYQGAQAAKKVRRTLAADPIGNVTSQVVGVIGGIVKTAAVAFGAKERDMQKFLNDANSLQYAGTFNYQSSQVQSQAFASQMTGMKAQGTSYTSSTPTLKNKKGFVEELGKRMLVERVAEAGGWDKDIVNSAIRGELGRREQKKADKKAQADAARSTAITVVTTVATMGAAAAASGATSGLMATVGKGLTTIGFGSAKVGAAIVKTAVQVIDGSRNGTQGMLAGLANGMLGFMSIGEVGKLAPDASMLDQLKNSAVGLGVSYDRKAGWGGMVGVGNNLSNLGVSFSQRGNTSVSGSLGSQDVPIQLTFSHTTNGSTTLGMNYNQGLGDRNGLNIGINRDLTRGETTGTVGYTDRQTGLGINASINRNGLSTSIQSLGTNLGTMTANGYQANEINWMEQNINAAQDKQQNYENKRAKELGMKLLGKSEEEYDAMTPKEKEDAFEKIKPNAGTKEQGNIAVDTSRKSFAEKFFGGMTDSFRNSISIAMGSTDFSSASVEFKDGTAHIRTCFTAGTLVHTKDGTKVIEDIQIGDVVLSWNEKTGEREYKTVTNLWVRKTNLLYAVKLPRKEPIVTTWNHPFWSVTQSAWIETKDLKEGEILSLGDGSEISIESITHYETAETTVYNFEVEGNHTYYVSEAGVLVHNQGSEYNGVVTDPMQILYSMFAPVKKEQVTAALKKVDEPKSAMESAACNGPTGAVCTGMKVTGHLLDGEYSEAGDIVVDRAGENILGFAVGYGIGGLFRIGKSFTAVPGTSPSKIASQIQGKGTYPGVDKWRDITLKDGKTVVGGIPGQSNFYTTESGLERSGLNKTTLFEGLQVSKHPKHGYRDFIGIYKVEGNTSAAVGTTHANPQFGSGGLPQIFIPDYSNLRLIEKKPLK